MEGGGWSSFAAPLPDAHPASPVHYYSALYRRTLRLLKMAREALIYLSLAMHREETLREEASQDDAGTKGSLVPGQVESFQRP